MQLYTVEITDAKGAEALAKAVANHNHDGGVNEACHQVEYQGATIHMKKHMGKRLRPMGISGHGKVPGNSTYGCTGLDPQWL